MLTAKTTEQEKHSLGKTLSEKELIDARNLLKIFLQAWKNYSLYPEGHATSRKSLETLLSAFADFFSKHGDLGLVVEKERLLWGDSVIHEVPSGAAAEDIIFPLYRDGIIWIEFQQGLPLEELASIFNILNKYKFLQEETEGDIVTELIDTNLTYIKFKKVDILWQDYPLLDFSSLNTPAIETEDDSSQNEPEEIEQEKSAERTDTIAKSIADPSFNEAMWEISPAEHEELRQMILKEENWDNTDDVFDALVAILQAQTDKHDFSSALDFTLEEALETIEQGEFGLLLNLFQSLHQLAYKEISAEYSWIRPLVERFFQDLSRPEAFNVIGARVLALNDDDTGKIESLRHVFLYFDPDAILSLGPIILQTPSQEVQKMILEVTEHLCLKDMGPLEKILEHPDKKLGEAFLSLLIRLKGERANKIFLKMIEHPSEKVRVQAIKMLMAEDPKFASKLFFLIDDPDEGVRKEILSAIAGQKSSIVENLLLKYIKESLTQKKPEHILACYEALSGCGAITSFQFLKRILLSQGWNSFTGFGKPLHRQSAATALALMGTLEAKEILLEASESKHQVIRNASQAAMARSAALRGNSNG